jgi:hypothetical protein
MTIFHVKRTSSQDLQEWLDNFKGLKVFVTIVKFIVMIVDKHKLSLKNESLSPYIEGLSSVSDKVSLEDM